MVSKHDKAVKKRKKREEKKKNRKSDDLAAPASEEEKSMGRMGIMIFVSIGIVAAAFILYSYS